MRCYVSFYRKHRDLYASAEDASNVAVLRSFASIAYHQSRAQVAAVLAEQAPIQSKIPFDLVFDEHLGDLSKYRVLTLPDLLCLSDSQLVTIRESFENGGGLVASGQAGVYDEWRRYGMSCVRLSGCVSICTRRRSAWFVSHRSLTTVLRSILEIQFGDLRLTTLSLRVR